MHDIEKNWANEPLLNEASLDSALHAAEHSGDSFDDSVTSRRPARSRVWLVHVILITSYTLLTAAVLLVSHGWLSSQLPLPAREVLRPELRYFPTKLENNPLAAKPGPERDNAWHSLLASDNIKLPRARIDALNLNSIYTRDGSEGIASLSVYHSIHCIKKVHEMMYKEHYHVGKGETVMRRELKHADHCVEYLRESVMCKPDLSLVTYRWINDTAQHPDDPEAFYPTSFDSGLHECMEWEPLEIWAKARSFNLYNVDGLDRPM